MKTSLQKPFDYDCITLYTKYWCVKQVRTRQWVQVNLWTAKICFLRKSFKRTWLYDIQRDEIRSKHFWIFVVLVNFKHFWCFIEWYTSTTLAITRPICIIKTIMIYLIYDWFLNITIMIKISLLEIFIHIFTKAPQIFITKICFL